jgi:hypothetical protein
VVVLAHTWTHIPAIIQHTGLFALKSQTPTHSCGHPMRQFHWHPSLAVEPGSGKSSGLDNDKTRRVPRCPTSHFCFLNFPAQLSPLTAQQSSLRPDPSKTTHPLLLLFLTLFYHICLRLLAIPSGNTKATQPNQPKDHPVAQQHQLDDSFCHWSELARQRPALICWITRAQFALPRGYHDCYSLCDHGNHARFQELD